MRNPLITAIGAVAIAVVVSACAGGQTPADEKWAPARTPWGDPDLQGQWNSQTSTPLERPLQGKLAGKETISEDEAEDFESSERATFDAAPTAGDPGTYNAFWRDQGKALTRTSLVIDPPDGRIPAYTPATQARLAAARKERSARGSADSYADFNPWTRCISRGWNGIGSWYSSNTQIFQSPGYVVVFQELIHEPRIIPLDGRAHLPQNVDQWLGNSRGHFEGTTLVVETTNFDPRASYRNSSPMMQLTERFFPVDENTLDYQFTVNDPTVYTKPWTVSRPMRRQTGAVTLFEYACHEGNHAMAHMLAGARAVEKAGRTPSRGAAGEER